MRKSYYFRPVLNQLNHWAFISEQLVVLESILIHHPPVISFCTNLISIRSLVSSKGMAMPVLNFSFFSLKKKGASPFYFTLTGTLTGQAL